jgi:hypothetical protein
MNEPVAVLRPVLQVWVMDLPMMQQTVLLTAIRGPDGITKYHNVKFLLRWYRRCILHSSMGGMVFTTPHEQGGGSFTGPSYFGGDTKNWSHVMQDQVTAYLQTTDEMPMHFHTHLMHGAEILGYMHPDTEIRSFWNLTYIRFCKDMHVLPEPKHEMLFRLGDNEANWRAASDVAKQE